MKRHFPQKLEDLPWGLILVVLVLNVLTFSSSFLPGRDLAKITHNDKGALTGTPLSLTQNKLSVKCIFWHFCILLLFPPERILICTVPFESAFCQKSVVTSVPLEAMLSSETCGFLCKGLKGLSRGLRKGWHCATGHCGVPHPNNVSRPQVSRVAMEKGSGFCHCCAMANPIGKHPEKHHERNLRETRGHLLSVDAMVPGTGCAKRWINLAIAENRDLERISFFLSKTCIVYEFWHFCSHL